MLYIRSSGAGEIRMDINYLFYRQQVERIRATTARSDEAKIAHEQLARCYETMIAEATSDEFQFLPEQSATNALPQR
jgi:hypothetical protein